MEQLDAASEDIVNQMFLDTTTWALPMYEAEANLTVHKDSTYEDRRSAIMVKEKANGDTPIHQIWYV